MKLNARKQAKNATEKDKTGTKEEEETDECTCEGECHCGNGGPLNSAG